MAETVRRLVADRLDVAALESVVNIILQEADLDGDEKLSYVEFEHVVARSPNFVSAFSFRM